MVKPKVAKIFKVVKKTVDEKDQLVVRYKNVDKKRCKKKENTNGKLNIVNKRWK